MRFIVGFGVVGVAAVDMPLLQEFLPAAKRGWISFIQIIGRGFGSRITDVIGMSLSSPTSLSASRPAAARSRS